MTTETQDPQTEDLAPGTRYAVTLTDRLTGETRSPESFVLIMQGEDGTDAVPNFNGQIDDFRYALIGTAIDFGRQIDASPLELVPIIFGFMEDQDSDPTS